MKNQMNFSQSAQVMLGKTDKSQKGGGQSLNLRGEFAVEHWRDGMLLQILTFKNGITDEGKDSIFDIMFDAQTQITLWYMGLIDLVGFTALDAGDTADDIDQAVRLQGDDKIDRKKHDANDDLRSHRPFARGA